VRAVCPAQAIVQPLARSRRADVEVGFGQIKDRFRIAELEVDPPVPDVNGRHAAHHGPVDKRSEIPAPRAFRWSRFHQVDAGILQPDRRDAELAAQQRPEAWPYFHRLHVSDRLAADRGIFVDDHARTLIVALDGKSGTFEQAEAHASDVHLPA